MTRPLSWLALAFRRRLGTRAQARALEHARRETARFAEFYVKNYGKPNE